MEENIELIKLLLLSQYLGKILEEGKMYDPVWGQNVASIAESVHYAIYNHVGILHQIPKAPVQLELFPGDPV